MTARENYLNDIDETIQNEYQSPKIRECVLKQLNAFTISTTEIIYGECALITWLNN